MSERAAEGAIYDIGYQRYQGKRLGRGYAIRTLFIHSLRTAFGIGRGDKARTLPVLVGALVILPALLQVGIASAAGMVAITSYPNQLSFTAMLLVLFAAGQAPELIVTDKQNGTLALYLSRPLTSIDYAIAKIGALWSAMFLLTFGPQLLIFIGRVFLVTKPWPAFQEEWTKLVPMLGGSLLISLCIAAAGLSLASFAARRGYASAAVICFFLLTGALGEMVRAVATGTAKAYAELANFSFLISGFAGWLFEIEARRRTRATAPDVSGLTHFYTLLVITAIGLAIFMRRYRRPQT